MEFIETVVEVAGKKWSVVHNLPTKGPNNINDALSVWKARVHDFSAENFCQFINEKRERGLCDYYAFTPPEFYKWIESQAKE